MTTEKEAMALSGQIKIQANQLGEKMIRSNGHKDALGHEWAWNDEESHNRESPHGYFQIVCSRCGWRFDLFNRDGSFVTWTPTVSCDEVLLDNEQRDRMIRAGETRLPDPAPDMRSTTPQTAKVRYEGIKRGTHMITTKQNGHEWVFSDTSNLVLVCATCGHRYALLTVDGKNKARYPQAKCKGGTGLPTVKVPAGLPERDTVVRALNTAGFRVEGDTNSKRPETVKPHDLDCECGVCQAADIRAVELEEQPKSVEPGRPDHYYSDKSHWWMGPTDDGLRTCMRCGYESRNGELAELGCDVVRAHEILAQQDAQVEEAQSNDVVLPSQSKPLLQFTGRLTLGRLSIKVSVTLPRKDHA